MSTDLSPDHEDFIRQEISKGTFADRREALEAGVDVLKQRRQLVDRLKESRRQLDEGESTDYDGPGLRQLFEQLKERSRTQAESRPHGS